MTRLAGRYWRQPFVLDVGLAVVVAVVVCAAISVAVQPGDEPGGDRPADPLAYGLGCAIGGLLLLRRRWPAAVLLGSGAVLLVYYALEYPGVTPAVPLCAALFAAAAAGRLFWALGVAGFFVVLGIYVRVTHLREAMLPMFSGIVEQTALLLTVVLLAQTLRSRRERLALAAVEREREAGRRVGQERLRIARETHDILGHTITAIGIQATLAEDVFDSSPDRARAALVAIRTATRQATSDLRAAMDIARTDTPTPPPPAPGLDRLDPLLDVVRQSGLRVAAEKSLSGVTLPASVDVTAYRIVQEALTNTMRHAGASAALVRLTQTADELLIDVTDDGTDGAGRLPGGHGLAGMAERISALSGSLRAGPKPGGGFQVTACLPLTGPTG